MVACSKRAHQFDPHCMDDDGDTPLSKARSNGKQPVVDYLQTAIGTFIVYFCLCIIYIQLFRYGIDSKFPICKLPAIIYDT